MRAYSDSTMGVLKVAFINAGIIDFFSSLSIAILAVFLGLGHLGLIDLPGFSGLHLWQSLFILMMAPDYFAPFRRYAEQYHAKAEGVAAAGALEWLFAPAGRRQPGGGQPVPGRHRARPRPCRGGTAGGVAANWPRCRLGAQRRRQVDLSEGAGRHRGSWRRRTCR